MIKKCFGTIVDLLVVALEFFSVCPMCNYEAPISFSLVCVPILSCVFICGTGR